MSLLISYSLLFLFSLLFSRNVNQFSSRFKDEESIQVWRVSISALKTNQGIIDLILNDPWPLNKKTTIESLFNREQLFGFIQQSSSFTPNDNGVLCFQTIATSQVVTFVSKVLYIYISWAGLRILMSHRSYRQTVRTLVHSQCQGLVSNSERTHLNRVFGLCLHVQSCRVHPSLCSGAVKCFPL